MIEWALIEGFEWDRGNDRKSSEKHDVSSLEAEEVFQDLRVLIAPDQKHSDRETRMHALGKTATDRLLQVSFTLHQSNTRIRVISARDANRKERALYEKA